MKKNKHYSQFTEKDLEEACCKLLKDIKIPWVCQISPGLYQVNTGKTSFMCNDKMLDSIYKELKDKIKKL